MITYNHEKFIAQAIESVMMQKTNFPIELIIGEDCSTDNTRAICIEYQKKYPKIIELQLPEINKGMTRNCIENMLAAKGKYIALCEGDDYWTDPLKLQKQVDFLEANPDYSLCCHRYKIYNENTKELTLTHESLFENLNSDGIEIDVETNLKAWLTKTVTVAFRMASLDLSLMAKYNRFYDAHLFYSLLSAGKGYCLNFDGAVYRIHSGGIYSSIEGGAKKVFFNYKIYEELFYYNHEDLVLKKTYDGFTEWLLLEIINEFLNLHFHKTTLNILAYCIKAEKRQHNLIKRIVFIIKSGLKIILQKIKLLFSPTK
jgi:glycosyltransferase involved in cell wall biosynthesis